MKDMDWAIIFRLKEFSKYYTSKELIQLSLISKKIKNCLTSAIFNTFNFDYFANKKSYKRGIIFKEELLNGNFAIFLRNPFKHLDTKMIKSKDQFKLDLKLIISQPQKLELYNVENYYYLLCDVPSTFTRLTTITISNSRFNYQVLQYLLDNLGCLSNLELSNNYLIQSIQKRGQNLIDWPITLIKLKAIDNHITFVEDNESPILFMTDRVYNAITRHLSFSLKCLPKLVSFEYELLSLQGEYENLFQFLTLNPQISNLKITVFYFYPEIFTSISYIYRLSRLYLKFIQYEIGQIEFNNLPVLNSVIVLTINFLSQANFNIFEKFPNLTELFVEVYSKDLEELFTLTKIFSTIKSLNLKIYLSNKNIREFTIPKLDNLKSLEFILGHDINLNDINWNVDSCKNIKFVKLTNDQDKARSTLFDLSKFNKKFADYWKVVYYPHKITYYKIF